MPGKNIPRTGKKKAKAYLGAPHGYSRETGGPTSGVAKGASEPKGTAVHSPEGMARMGKTKRKM